MIRIYGQKHMATHNKALAVGRSARASLHTAEARRYVTTMKNNHDVEIYNNGYGWRIALEIYTGTRLAITIEDAIKLKESLEYGIAKAPHNQAFHRDPKRPADWSERDSDCFDGSDNITTR